MADNIAITAGSGTSVATDDVSGLHYQRVKLSDGTADASTPIAAGNGTNASALRVTVASDSTGTSIVTQATASNLNAQTVGNVAHDAADSGNPVKVGGRAIAGISGVTLVAADDRADMLCGLDGVQIVRPYCGLEDIVSGRITDTAGAAIDVIAAKGAGIKTYLTGITIYNDSSTNVYADVLDGASIKWTVPLPAKGGATINFTVPLPGTANTAWRLDVSAATSTVYASFIGFKSKV